MKSIYYWSPFTSKVATVNAVINSAYSLNKYSKEFETFIINSFGEWDEYAEELKIKGINLVNINNSSFLKRINRTGYFRSRFSYILIFLYNFYPLLKLFINKKPDYLLIHLITSLPILLKIIFPIKTKIILRISGLPKLNPIRKMFWRLGSKYLYKITCPTNETLTYLKDLKIFNENKIYLLRDPVVSISEINKKKNEKIDESFIKEKKYILAVGRLTKQKNFIFLIEGFKEIIKNFNYLQLIIIGDGEEKKVLEEKIIKNNLQDNVFLIGYKKNVYKYYDKCLFFVLCSLWEDPGFVLIEAFASNTLVLSSNCPNGPKEIINNENNGFLFTTNRKDHFLQKLYYILENKNKEEIKNKILGGKIESKKYTKYAHFKIINKVLM
jgi:glycosyltransferase involved in cell wall biosynthesis